MRTVTKALATGIAVLATGALVAPGAMAVTSAVVEGAGSTWSQVAVDQWRADVKSRLGLKVNYTGTGSSTGRSLYVQG
jgi:phosphate transport system substrate-binding protein